MASKLQTIAEPQHRLTLKQIQNELKDDLHRVCKELSRWRDSYDNIFSITLIDFRTGKVYLVDCNNQPETIPLELFTYSDSELHEYVDKQIQTKKETMLRRQELNKERRRKQYEELKKEFEGS